MRDSPVVVNIHIKTVDGGVQYPNALSTNVKDGILRVQVGAGGDESDTIYFSPNYWQQYVVDHQRRPHRLRVGLPPTRRTLHIGEQKRHHPRRSSRRSSGHPSRISQRTCS